MTLFITLPFGTLTVAGLGQPVTTDLLAYDFVELIIPVGLAIAFGLIDIFIYHNLKRQKTIALLTLGMTIISCGIAIYIINGSNILGDLSWRWNALSIAGAMLFNVLAIVGINHDIKLLRSYDRLR